MKNDKNKKRRNSHGAVSVFLAMVLVPCMIFACAFGDVSRVQLSKSQAATAADLALYSLMANYDEELKEWYGLVASCQTIDEFYDETAKYFTGMMDANGVDGTASKLFLSYLDSLRTGDDFTDFLQVSFVEEAKTEGMKDASLGKNPALIEDGIVEFMKYRGPVEIVAKVVDRFKKLGVLDALEGVDKDKPIVDAKTEAAKAEGEMLSEMVNTYMALLSYSDYYTSHDTLKYEKFQNDYPEQLDYIREDLRPITELITEYYALQELMDMRSSIPVRSLPALSSDGESAYYSGTNRTFTRDTLPGVSIKEEDGEKTYSLGEYGLNSILQNYNSYINAISSSANRIAEALNGIHAPNVDDINNNVNPALYMAKVQNVLAGSDLLTIKSNADYLMAVYGQILMAEKCELPDPQPGAESWNSRLSRAKNEIVSCLNSYLTYSDGTTPYEQRLRQYNEIATKLVPSMDESVNPPKESKNSITYMVNHATYPFSSQYLDGEHTTVGTWLMKNVVPNYQKIVEDVQHQVDLLTVIIDGGTTTWSGPTSNTVHEVKTVSLDQLKQAILDYQNKRDDWGTAAGEGTTEYAAGEKDEYDHPEKNDKLAQPMYELDVSEVDELKSRLVNIRSALQAFLDAMNSFTYANKALYQYTGKKELFANAESVAIPTDTNQIRPYLSENREDAARYYNSLVSPLNEAVYTAQQPIHGKAGNNFDIDEHEEEPSLYRFMKNTISVNQLDKVASEKEAYDSDVDDLTKDSKDKSDASKKMNTDYLNDLGKDPGSHGHSDGGLDAGTLLTSTIGVVTKLLSGNFDEFRDQLYVCEYAMDMFSWASYNNEGQFKLSLKDKDGDQYALKDYDKTNHGFAVGTDQYIKKWGGDKGVYIDGAEMLTKFDNQSLTNRAINSKNNASNLAEIEYILYGKATNEDNIGAACTDLFVIREALNLVAGFQLFYPLGSSTTGDIIDAVAVAISGATMGIVPVPLIKCIVIGLLATFETIRDLDRLKAGIPVALYKNEEEKWTYAIKKLPMGTVDSERTSSPTPSIKSLFGSIVDDPKDTNGLYYSDYMYIFLAISANSSNYSDMLLRIGDLIEANMNAGQSAGKKAEGSGEGSEGGGSDKGGSAAFDLDKAIVFFHITGKLRVKPLFMAWPVVNSMENVDTEVLNEKVDWCTYRVDMIRGYS